MGKERILHSRKVTDLDHLEVVGLLYMTRASSGVSLDVFLASFGDKWTRAPDKACEGRDDQEAQISQVWGSSPADVLAKDVRI